MSYIANAISRSNLREFAAWIRKTVGYESKPYFPIVEFLENVMPQIFPSFNYEIVEDYVLGGKEGLTLPHQNLILLPETVYNEAVEGKGRARFTVAHEVSHYILIDDGSIALARSDSRIPAYQNPEWQANALASEILIVPRLSQEMSIDEVAKTFGVSQQAAKVHLKIKQCERLP